MLNLKNGRHSYLIDAARYYRRLFKFPSYPNILILTVCEAALGSLLAFLVIYPSVKGLIDGLLFAVMVFILPTFMLDFLISRYIIKSLVLDLRRIAALSLVATLFQVMILNISSLSRVFTERFWLTQGFFLGVCVACQFRVLVLKCVSTLDNRRLYFASLLPPLLSGLIGTRWFAPTCQQILVMVTVISILIGAALMFVYIVNTHGKSFIGIGAVDLFKAFLANWLVGLTAPLEEYFDALGEEADVTVRLLGFLGNGSLKAIMVVPDIHPGPFRNIGSSNLPWEIQQTLQAKSSAVVMVPHGASGHELDLTSGKYRDLVLASLSQAASFTDTLNVASEMIRVRSGSASATCQFLGDTALVTVTCAPASMEDIPFEVGDNIITKGKALGAHEVVLIDAHNSIGCSGEIPFLTDNQLDDLASAAVSAIDSALKLPRYPFTLGAARIVPQEFGVEQGVGPGGIAVAVINVNGQETAYIVVDGNNMISGLRERILESLSDILHDAEIMTTDTHVVNAVTTVDRGYSPVGESIDQERFLLYVRECVIAARNNEAASSIGYKCCLIPRVRVIGETKLRRISILVGSAMSLSKRLAILLFLPAIMASLLLFAIL
ncbi:MAG: DUF2070 family protein [Candidatus Bathyarchaeia archaeon]